MRRIEIKAGQKFGELTVIKEVDSTGKRKFLCKCSCGAKKEVRLGHLRSNHTTSCGACGIEYNGKRQTLKAWAEEYNMPESTLRFRLKTMDMREALRR